MNRFSQGIALFFWIATVQAQHTFGRQAVCLPQPVIMAGGPTSFCNGGSVVLSAPEGYTGYRWADGVTSRTRTVTQPGSYSVTVSNDEACSSDPSLPVVISWLPQSPQPTITVTGSTSFCIGGSTTLSAPEGYDQYVWSDGTSTRTRIIQQAGRHSVAVKGAGVCLSAFSASVNITVVPVPARPAITVTGHAAFCAGSPGDVELFAPGGYDAYRWSTGATTRSIKVANPGNYSVVVITACESPVSDAVTIKQGAAPATPQTILLRPDHSLQAAGGGPLYQWRLNGALLPETTNRLPLTGEGIYEVRSQNSDGCLSLEAVTYTYHVTVATEEDIAALWRVYPNPASSALTIEARATGQAALQLINLQGVVMRHAVINLGDKNVLPLDGLPTGLYYLMIQKDHRTIIRKMTIVPQE